MSVDRTIPISRSEEAVLTSAWEPFWLAWRYRCLCLRCASAPWCSSAGAKLCTLHRTSSTACSRSRWERPVAETDQRNVHDDLVTVELDQDVCVGVGQCELLEGGVFRLDDDEGISTVIGDGRLPRRRAEIVVEKCPSSAISICEEEQQ
ncbi:MAG: ferredoxin [Acidimicrobiaceae bacterium]|nr:ferredoxin [Acidimicrobiaceae bacterium]MYA74906.1 ferredoxin [Acidimicrobiaceae bacterium]MYD05734.1 ferredoxin [Acidimicrobiaceae bacterium]MYG56068.1 ferredoxin [Acidimicrobiaceae bacterium]MYI57759.1 ferredoxin [Acidimicrobiaceae bacterium]